MSFDVVSIYTIVRIELATKRMNEILLDPGTDEKPASSVSEFHKLLNVCLTLNIYKFLMVFTRPHY